MHCAALRIFSPLVLLALFISTNGCFETRTPALDLAGTDSTMGLVKIDTSKGAVRSDTNNRITKSDTNITTAGSVVFAFKDGDYSIAHSGTAEIFGATQIPLPDLNPDALLTLAIERDTNFVLSPDSLRKIPISAWPLGSNEGDSIFRFNVVMTDLRDGCIFRNLAYIKKKSRIIFVNSTRWVADSNDVLRPEARMFSLYESRMTGRQETLAGNEQYLFIIGTGYIAKEGPDKKYIFKSAPLGRADMRWVTVWTKESQPAVLPDSLLIYGLRDKPDTKGTELFDVDSIYTKLPLPPNFRK